MPLLGSFRKADIEKLARKRDVPGLCRELATSREPMTRWRAASALRKIGGAQAFEPLVAALDDADSRVRGSAAYGLGEIRDARAVKPLISLLKDESAGMAAVNALDQLGWTPDGGEAGAWYWALKENWSYSAERGACAVDALLNGLVRSSQYNPNIVPALAKIGAPAVEPLIRALDEHDPKVRRGVAEGLGRIGDGRAVEPLVSLLGDADARVRDAAANALGQLPDGNEAVEPLIRALDDTDYGVRYAAAEALGRRGDGRAVAALIAVLAGPAATGNAVRALSRLAGAGAVEPLIGALGRGDSVAQAAAVELGQIGDARAIDPLITALTSADGNLVGAAAEALARIGDARAIDPLIAALRSADENLVAAAAKALGRFGDPRAVDPLLAIVRTHASGDRPEAMFSVVEALGELADRGAIAPLKQAVGNETPEPEPEGWDDVDQGDWQAYQPWVYAAERAVKKIEERSMKNAPTIAAGIEP